MLLQHILDAFDKVGSCLNTVELDELLSGDENELYISGSLLVDHDTGNGSTRKVVNFLSTNTLVRLNKDEKEFDVRMEEFKPASLDRFYHPK